MPTLRRAKMIFKNVVHMYWKTTELKDDIRILWLPVGGQITEQIRRLKKIENNKEEK